MTSNIADKSEKNNWVHLYLPVRNRSGVVTVGGVGINSKL